MTKRIVYQYDDIDVDAYIEQISMELEEDEITYKCFHKKECSPLFWENLIKSFGEPKQEDIILLKIQRDE